MITVSDDNDNIGESLSAIIYNMMYMSIAGCQFDETRVFSGDHMQITYL